VTSSLDIQNGWIPSGQPSYMIFVTGFKAFFMGYSKT